VHSAKALAPATPAPIKDDSHPRDLNPLSSLSIPGGGPPPAATPPALHTRTLQIGVVELRLKGEDRSAVILSAPWPGAGEGSVRGGRGGGPKPTGGGPTGGLALLDGLAPSAGTPLEVAPPAPGDHARAHATIALTAGGPAYSVAAVFDGHNGPNAAAHCAAELAAVLRARLPPGPPPPGEVDSEDECDWGAEDAGAAAARAAAGEAWRGALAAALAAAFHDLQHGWAARGRLGGTTATVALQAGRLVTVANVGDSLALLDSGASVMPLTGDHR